MAHFPKWTLFFKQTFGLRRLGVLALNLSPGKKETFYDTGSSIFNGVGEYRNGFLTARISAHTLIYVGKKKIDLAKKYFIDNGIGFNFDYNFWGRNKNYQVFIFLMINSFTQNFQCKFITTLPMA